MRLHLRRTTADSRPRIKTKNPTQPLPNKPVVMYTDGYMSSGEKPEVLELGALVQFKMVGLILKL
jgi:hypothetical protein